MFALIVPASEIIRHGGQKPLLINKNQIKQPNHKAKEVLRTPDIASNNRRQVEASSL
jgi:hypothetical protein